MSSVVHENKKARMVTDIFLAYKNLPESYLEKRGQFFGERAILLLSFTSSLIFFLCNIPSDLVSLSSTSLTGTTWSYFGILFFVSIFFVPLFLYSIAAVLHMILLLFKGRGSFADCRLAFFWSINVSAPILLLNGFARAYFYKSSYLYLCNITFGVILAWIISSMVAKSEKFKSNYPLFLGISVFAVGLEVLSF